MKLDDLRKQLRGLDPDCPRPAPKRSSTLAEDLKRTLAPPWSDGKRRVTGLDVGVGGDETAMVTMSGADGVITLEDVARVPRGMKEIPFTGVHRLIHEPEDLSERRICKAVNAVPGAVVDDFRFATDVRSLGKSLGDRYLRKTGGDHRAWIKSATTFVNAHLEYAPSDHFVLCPSQSDVPALVKYVAPRGPTASGPDEPMRTMFVAVAATAQLDAAGIPQPVRLHRCSAFALYPAEVRLCWTCGGSRITKTLARVSEAEPEWAPCPVCSGLGTLWDHRPYHAQGDIVVAHFAKRFEDAPAPSRLDR